jgi:hypothetical protein
MHARQTRLVVLGATPPLALVAGLPATERGTSVFGARTVARPRQIGNRNPPPTYPEFPVRQHPSV